jgi:regulatory protein
MPRRRSDESQAPEPGTARLAALRLLGRRDYSAAEIRTRLLDRGHNPAEVESAVTSLVGDGAIDDRRTAFAHVRTAARIKGRGTHRIRRELEARGISAGIIADALAQLSPDDDRAAIARILARRRTTPSDPGERRRLFQQLMRRGFSADIIAKALAFDPDDL